jgi:hypothetical protein
MKSIIFRTETLHLLPANCIGVSDILAERDNADHRSSDILWPLQIRPTLMRQEMPQASRKSANRVAGDCASGASSGASSGWF